MVYLPTFTKKNKPNVGIYTPYMDAMGLWTLQDAQTISILPLPGSEGIGSLSFWEKNGRGVWLFYSFQGVYITLSKLSTFHDFHYSNWKYRWHSPYTLVYKDPLLTYLFGIGKPSILNLKVNQIVNFRKLANIMFKFYQPFKVGKNSYLSFFTQF